MGGGSALYTERTDKDAANERTPIFDETVRAVARQERAASVARALAWLSSPLLQPKPRRADLVSVILIGCVVLLIVALITKAA